MPAPKKISMLFAAVFTLFAAADASAQAVPVAEAEAFLGAWVISIEGTPLELNILDEDGLVAADVMVMGTTARVTDVTKEAEALKLSYVADLEGQQMPITMRLTPAGENLAMAIDVADGMFTANATATRKP